jgi:CheY-like chemotaxis protein
MLAVSTSRWKTGGKRTEQVGSNERRRILVVEDDADLRSALEMLLMDDGFEVVSAEHGGVALRILERSRPDAILLDLNMPVMDGETFAHRFRDRYGSDVPIVIYTATPKPRIAERIGNARVLRKPVELDDLLSVLHSTTSIGS